VPDIYTHGHHDSVLRSHRWRTAENSAGYLLDSLRPGQDLLDVGCGPGTVTIDLARRVDPGSVVGLDRAAEVIEEADQLRAQAGAGNVTFAVGDVYSLTAADDSFDVVHAHQVLQHLSRPVDALREMQRVLRPGGILAVRDSDYGAFTWAPADPRLDRWLELYHAVTIGNGADADAGRHLLGWVREAGFVDIRVTSSTWTFADPESRAWWGGLWAERVRLSSLAEQAQAHGLADAAELAGMADAWLRWAEHPDGFFAVLHAEVLARPPDGYGAPVEDKGAP
jgi:SAM-dependent methyltransferase